MSEQLLDLMRLDVARAKGDLRDPSHWLMTFAAFNRMRDECRGPGDLHKTDEEPKAYGFTIYLTSEVDAPDGFLLCSGDPPDALREQELRRQLRSIEDKFMKVRRPIIEELVKLEARKAPKPATLRT